MKRSEILERGDYKEINKIELSRELTVILTLYLANEMGYDLLTPSNQKGSIHRTPF